MILSKIHNIAFAQCLLILLFLVWNNGLSQGQVRSLSNINSKIYDGPPDQVAKEFLLENREIFGIKKNLEDIEITEIKRSPAAHHIGFLQKYRGIPVFRSDIVVSINNENQVSMVVSGYMPGINIPRTRPTILASSAVNSVRNALRANESTLITQPSSELYVYKDSLDVYHLAWKINFVAQDPIGDWQAFVDALTGEILSLDDISFRYVNGTGKVFDPDPVSALSNASLTDMNNTDYAALAGAYDVVTLYDLNDAVGGVYKVQGRYARSEDIEVPNTAIVTSTTEHGFQFNRSQPGFEEVNVYYHIDKHRRYIGGLGFSPQWFSSDAIRFDAHGLNGADNSHYVPSSKYLAYGDGCVDDAEDQDVVLHEYGHALHDVLLGGSGGLGAAPPLGDQRKISEGSGDYLAVSYRRTVSSFQPNKVFPWDGIPSCWPARFLNSTYVYPTNWSGLHTPAGILWASTMMDVESQAGIGRAVSTTLLLSAFPM